jgi:hypothetical protein
MAGAAGKILFSLLWVFAIARDFQLALKESAWWGSITPSLPLNGRKLMLAIGMCIGNFQHRHVDASSLPFNGMSTHVHDIPMSDPSNHLYRSNDGRRTGSGLGAKLFRIEKDWQVIDTAKTCTLVFDWFLNPDKSGNWEICISV